LEFYWNSKGFNSHLNDEKVKDDLSRSMNFWLNRNFYTLGTGDFKYFWNLKFYISRTGIVEVSVHPKDNLSKKMIFYFIAMIEWHSNFADWYCKVG